MIVSAKLDMALWLSPIMWMSLIIIIMSMPVTVAQTSVAEVAFSSSYPKLLDLDFSPRELIQDRDDSKIVLETHVANEDEDIESIEAIFSSPSHNQSAAAIMNATNLISGDARNGNYSTVLSFSPSCQVGTWTLKHLIICDSVGNCRRINTTVTEMLGFPTKLQVNEKAENKSMTYLQGLKERSLHLGLDTDELRGWASTEKRFFAQRKIIINNVFNRPSICWP